MTRNLGRGALALAATILLTVGLESPLLADFGGIDIIGFSRNFRDGGPPSRDLEYHNALPMVNVGMAGDGMIVDARGTAFTYFADASLLLGTLGVLGVFPIHYMMNCGKQDGMPVNSGCWRGWQQMWDISIAYGPMARNAALQLGVGIHSPWHIVWNVPDGPHPVKTSTTDIAKLDEVSFGSLIGLGGSLNAALNLGGVAQVFALGAVGKSNRGWYDTWRVTGRIGLFGKGRGERVGVYGSYGKTRHHLKNTGAFDLYTLTIVDFGISILTGRW